MTPTVLANGATGGVIRNAINDNFSELSALIAAQPFTGRQQCAARSGVPSSVRVYTPTSGNTQFQYELGVDLLRDISDISFTFGNLDRTSAGPSGTNPMGALPNLTLRVGLYNGTDYFPLFWPNGSRSITLEGGAIASTIPMQLFGLKGQRWFLRVMGTYAAAPGRFPASDVIAYTSYELSEQGTALTDKTAGAASFSFARVGNYNILPPLAITSAVSHRVPVVGVLADSIGNGGSQDAATSYPEIGWCSKGLTAAGIPFVMLGQSNLALSMVMGLRPYRSQLLTLIKLAGVTHLFVPLATNDFAAGQTGAQIYANMQALAAELAPMGVAVVPTTCQPRTDINNSTTVRSGETSIVERTNFNSLIVTHNGVGAGYYDLGARAQDPDGIRWRSDLFAPSGFAINSAGSGYGVNSLLLLSNGAVLGVNTVDANGAITAIGTTTAWGASLSATPGVLNVVREVKTQLTTCLSPLGQGANFTVTAAAPQNTATLVTSDGIHPNPPIHAWVFPDFMAAAPTLFTLPDRA